jgi:hypothetical protein
VTVLETDLLATGRLFEAIELWLERWGVHRDAAMAEAIAAFAAALEPLPPPSPEVRLMGAGRGLRDRALAIGADEIFRPSSLVPSGPLAAARSALPRQIEADARAAWSQPGDDSVWRRLSTLPPSALLQKVLRQALATPTQSAWLVADARAARIAHAAD